MKMGIYIQESSVRDVTAELTRKQDNVLDAGHRGLTEAAEKLFEQAQAIVPRKTGALANSGKVTYEDRARGEVAIISYGDSSTNPVTGKATSQYAVAKHESPGPGSKWLETTMLGGYDLFMAALETHISHEL